MDVHRKTIRPKNYPADTVLERLEVPEPPEAGKG